jgi:hypothetical protein
MRPRDTSPEAHEVQLAVYRRMTVAQKLEASFELCESGAQIAMAGMRAREPELSDEGARLRVLGRLCGEALSFEANAPARGTALSPALAFRSIRDRLDTQAIPYMLAGSFACIAHGLVRTTEDLDLVIDASEPALAALVHSLPRDRYVVSERAEPAWLRRERLSVIDFAAGWKIDLILRAHSPFSLAAFARRQHAAMQGLPIFVATAEDAIVAALVGATHRQRDEPLRDAAGILEIRGARLDRPYIEHWARELGVGELWERVQREAAAS